MPVSSEYSLYFCIHNSINLWLIVNIFLELVRESTFNEYCVGARFPAFLTNCQTPTSAAPIL
jgi:hypothetical protein